MDKKEKKIYLQKKFHDNNLAYQLDEAKNREPLSLHKSCQESEIFLKMKVVAIQKEEL